MPYSASKQLRILMPGRNKFGCGKTICGMPSSSHYSQPTNASPCLASTILAATRASKGSFVNLPFTIRIARFCRYVIGEGASGQNSLSGHVAAATMTKNVRTMVDSLSRSISHSVDLVRGLVVLALQLLQPQCSLLGCTNRTPCTRGSGGVATA